MVIRPFARVLRAPLAGALAATCLVAVQPSSASAQFERRDTNPTGTRAGSIPNGVGNLKVSLKATSDGRIRVSWKRPGRAKNFKKFVVRVGPSRALDVRTRSYKVSPRRHSIVVKRAVDTSTASGNYTFVRVQAFRKKGGAAAAPASGSRHRSPPAAPLPPGSAHDRRLQPPHLGGRQGQRCRQLVGPWAERRLRDPAQRCSRLRDPGGQRL